jgi:Protein of unknown function (DUF1207)
VPALLAFGMAIASVVLPAQAALGEDDGFIRGYAAAVLQRDFQLSPDVVTVDHGVVTVHADLSEADRTRLTTALSQIAGVEDVVVLPATPQTPRWSWLPRRELFQPLIADPRWPRFAAAYQYYIGNGQLSDVAAFSFGESFPLLQYDDAHGGAWQLGLQGAVFAIFDLASSSFDLVNADYFFAVPVSYARGDFSALLRVLHQSSHLGDEYLLDHRVNRVNLSYEALDMLLSYQATRALRVYGGGGYIFAADPTDLGRGSLQAGVEYVGAPLDFWVPTRPVAALDLQFHGASDWTPNLSPNLGFQFGSGRGGLRNVRVLLEYFNGDSPNGQFYDRHIQYVGLGGQLTF